MGVGQLVLRHVGGQRVQAAARLALQRVDIVRREVGIVNPHLLANKRYGSEMNRTFKYDDDCCLNGGAQLRPDDGDSRALLKRVEDAYNAVECQPPGVNKAVLDVYHDWLGLENPLDGSGGGGDATLLRTTYHALEKTTNALNIRW
ncbi:hypothetical protein HPB51_018412 [Rhipicephalus microplus]|uniref:Uncharacterized protein n=1 Tax=Rhipicephalus microplus TaxID=6941 RepID=A0A9J6EUL9_RHIMP|nr:hypothetical protein HPB51_018412 [Rhipicephalus microplus]